MIAKIMHQDSVYYSPVLAVSLRQRFYKAVVFDSNYEELIVVDIFNIKDMKHTVLFMDFDTTDFSVKDDSLKSYWDDPNIFQKIQSKKYSEVMLEEAKKILAQMRIREYTDVRSQSDLEALEINSGSFHDGYILGMTEKNDLLEILLDTSWGALIVLRCTGILENTLQIGALFSYADMRLGDGCIEIAWNVMGNGEEWVLKVENLAFHPMFEQRISVAQTEFSVAKGQFIMKQKDKAQPVIIEPKNLDILDFSARNVLGYLELDDTVSRCFIFAGDVVYSFHQYSDNRKAFEKATLCLQKLRDDCQAQGMSFDVHPACDECWESYEHDYGQLLFSQGYGRRQELEFMCKPIFLGLALYNAAWLTIQMLNPEMKWSVYLVMGLGITGVFLLVCLAVYFAAAVREKRSGKANENMLEIYENGIKYDSYGTAFNTDYKSILSVVHKKRICIHTTFGKFELYRSKQDPVIYDLIAQRVEQAKERSQE